MSAAGWIWVEVIRAWPRRHEAIRLALPDTATVAEAVIASGFVAEGDGGFAIFGQHVAMEDLLHDGDRLEMLRPLEIDPKESRRRRARKAK